MSALSVSPLSIVNQIKSNLQDRYRSGYPILKELLQNADDSRARRFRVDALTGWQQDARNPLLRGPGLLVVNDGEFSREDRSGILSFGESHKAADRAAIGKFGLGQKAVFHLCDAFVVHAFGYDEPFLEVVNPFLKVEVAGNVTREWEELPDSDAALLRAAVSDDYGERALILWLPFRRSGLRPAPDAGFSSIPPAISQIVAGLARTDNLRTLLTALRHVESIEIRKQGTTYCAVGVHAAARMLGPNAWRSGVRSFSGSVRTCPEGSEARFVGREATILTERLKHLQNCPQWPRTINALSAAESEPEKGEPHGAATLVKAAHGDDHPSQLRISWAVFLPISETKDTELRVDAAVSASFHLLLHGYFFLDSGRRSIEWPGPRAGDDEPAEAKLRRLWNGELRDSVVLPLVPALLHDALGRGMVTAAELTDLAAAVVTTEWFENHRHAICYENAFVRVLEGPAVPEGGRVAWRLVPGGAALRPLPKAIADAPARFDELFADIHPWAQGRNIVLYIDPNASFTAERMRWTAAELGSLFADLTPRAFQSRRLATLLTDVLSEADPDECHPSTIGPHMVRALREALKDEATRLASSEDVSKVLAHAPTELMFGLPKSVELRRILGALASSAARILPVRGEWIPDAQPRSLTEGDLHLLLLALAPLVTGADANVADQAATAALALLAHHDISALAKATSFSDIAVLKGRDARTGETVVLSLKDLFERLRKGLVFRPSPGAENRLAALVDALPDVKPVIVMGRTAEFIQETAASGLRLLTPEKEPLFALINEAFRFGTEDARSRLLRSLEPRDGDDRRALRRLCAGRPQAGRPDAQLRVLPATDSASEAERVIAGILDRNTNEFLVPRGIARELPESLRDYLGIERIDTPLLEALLERNAEVIAQLEPTPSERQALLQVDLGPDLLRRLPIHDRSDGTVGSAVGIFREAAWRIPVGLRRYVRTVRLTDNPNARRRQQQIVSPWSPQAQVQSALAQAEPHVFRMEILQALAELAGVNNELPEGLTISLRDKRWLFMDTQGVPVAPMNVLTLPQAVGESARTLLSHRSDAQPLITADLLPIELQRHPGFSYVREHLLPDPAASLDIFTRMIERAELTATLGSADNYPVEDFAVLARAGDDLKLPGWRLLASVLVAIEGDHDRVKRIVASFRRLTNGGPELAGAHLDTLAKLAETNDSVGDAAEKAYRHGFDAVAEWSQEARRLVFRNTRVPTKGGGWRRGCEVIEEDNGVAAEHVLAPDYASVLSIRNGASTDPVADVPNDGTGVQTDDDLAWSTIDHLLRESVTQHRSFLEPWRGRVPPELVLAYLVFIERFDATRKYAREWEGDTTVDADAFRADLDRRKPPLILIEEVEGNRVQVNSLSGDRFDAPLAEAGSPELIVGNDHKRRRTVTDNHSRKRLESVTLKLRRIDPSTLSEPVDVFRRFVETVANECLRVSPRESEAIGQILDRASHVDQAMLRETEYLMRDRLPTMLEAMKLPSDSHCHGALQEYRKQEVNHYYASGSAEDSIRIKEELWERLREPGVANELLGAVRARIKELGYSAERVLFELFQNADDAYAQMDSTDEHACFRVESPAGGLRVVHWGRPINYLGRNADEGRRLGRNRDLLNMLVMDFSEKRPGQNLTGKFGLGFKTVHVLSDRVGIASGFIALRTWGGFLPKEWPDGTGAAESHKRDGRKATVIDIPAAANRATEIDRCFESFRTAATWLPVFARRIRRIEVDGANPMKIDCKAEPLTGDHEIEVVTVRGAQGQVQRALRFGVGDGYCLLLKVDAAGPCAFPDDLRRIWNLAPLEEHLQCGWLLNGPFAVDPGRGRLAGSVERRRELFGTLGRTLGERLLNLYDVMRSDWIHVASQLRLDGSEHVARTRFWSRLFEVVSRDLDDELAPFLHTDRHGYGRLVAERPVTPTGLPEPFDALVCASSVTRFTDGALTDSEVQKALRSWQSWVDLKGVIVISEVATRLQKLGFDGIRPMALADLLRQEMGEEKRIDVDIATKLGKIVTPNRIEQVPLDQERNEILDAARHASFRAGDGTWRGVQELSSTLGGSEDERRICDFAPEIALLHPDYRDESIEFFKVARARSGYSPQVHTLVEWAERAREQDRQRAVLDYLVDGRQGRDLAKAFALRRPPWMPVDATGTLSESSPLLRGWSDERKKELLIRLGHADRLGFLEPLLVTNLGQPSAPAVRIFLAAVHEWWRREGPSERDEYENSVYPSFYSPSQLRGTSDRTPWFTMFALACYQSLGRTQDEQHRGFLDRGWRDGWWREIAESRPPEEAGPWLDRLAQWSEPVVVDQEFLQWKRTFVDLYTVARWLDEYVEIVRELPRVVQDEGPVSVSAIFSAPSYSPEIRRIAVDAAPLNRSLGIGINWMVRELLRNDVYGCQDASSMTPYCWVPSQRVRELMNRLGADIDDEADPNVGRSIHKFVVSHCDSENWRFSGDFDLPLQLVTLDKHKAVRKHCFEAAGLEP